MKLIRLLTESLSTVNVENFGGSDLWHATPQQICACVAEFGPFTDIHETQTSFIGRVFQVTSPDGQYWVMAEEILDEHQEVVDHQVAIRPQ